MFSWDTDFRFQYLFLSYLLGRFCSWSLYVSINYCPWDVLQVLSLNQLSWIIQLKNLGMFWHYVQLNLVDRCCILWYCGLPPEIHVWEKQHKLAAQARVQMQKCNQTPPKNLSCPPPALSLPPQRASRQAGFSQWNRCAILWWRNEAQHWPDFIHHL